MSEKIAMLIIHGIGQQRPYETLDHFARGLLSAFRDDPNPPNWTVEPQMEVCKDPTHLQQSWVRVAYRLVPDQPVCFRSDCPNKISEITLYEYYWAPITQDKVSYIGSLTFLIKAGFQPFLYIASNINAIWKSRKSDLIGIIGREFWRIASLFLPLILVLAGLLGWLYRIFTSNSFVNDLKKLTAEIVLIFIFLFIRYLYILTTARALREARLVTRGWQKSLWWQGTLFAMLIGHVFLWPILVSPALCILAHAAEFISNHIFWLRFHLNLIQELKTTASHTVFPSFSAGPKENIIRFFLLDSYIWPFLPHMIWLLLAYLARFILIDYVGDIAVYANAQEQSKNFAARAQILNECSDSLSAILKRQRSISGAVAEESFFDRVFVIGHSLGSVIGYDVINVLKNRARTANNVVATDLQPEDLLNLRGMVTFGCPLNKFFYFFRERISPRQTLRSQTLNLLRGFRVRKDLNEFAPPIFPQINDKRWIVAEDCLQSGFRWINAYSHEDPISGKLLFYDLQEESNQKTFLYKWPFLAHVSYWDDSNFYDFIRNRLL
jgi:hypothetical protein